MSNKLFNRVFLNGEEISNFDNDEDAVYFAGEVVQGNEPEFPYTDVIDTVEVETEGAGRNPVMLKDISIDGIRLK